MKNLILRFIADETGATAIEYGLIASLVAVAVISSASSLGTKVGATFNRVSGNITTK